MAGNWPKIHFGYGKNIKIWKKYYKKRVFSDQKELDFSWFANDMMLFLLFDFIFEFATIFNITMPKIWKI